MKRMRGYTLTVTELMQTLTTICLLTLSAGVSAQDTQIEGQMSSILDRLDRLERELIARDERIAELEAEVVSLKPASHNSAPIDAPVPPSPTALPVKIIDLDTPESVVPTTVAVVPHERPEYFGEFQQGGLGMRVANTPYGDLSLGGYLQVRYVNQKGVDQFYTDAFGRTTEVDRRNDFQLNKATIQIQGWLGKPNLRYLAYAWTSNANLGNPGSVIVAGNLTWIFDDAINVGAGVNGLPSTRSMEGNWPSWNRMDTRLMADEFFRASFTTGLYAFGELGNGFSYKAMLGNNMSQLGVNAVELGDSLDTFAGALIWNPMGRYSNSFGDFEHSPNLVTRFAAHYTHSTEDRQSQPGEDDLENVQLRLSDGTVIFENGAFGTLGRINEARYQMVAMDAGVKYRGMALEAEVYLRRLDKFETIGFVPVDDVVDHGFNLQASMMLKPQTWQLYLGGSKIFGDYGNPWDAMVGMNYFPFKARQFRVNTELMYVDRSPVGNQTLPYAVGHKGPIFHISAELAI